MKNGKTNKSKARVLFLIISLAFFVCFSSCRSAYYQMEIEVREPAFITFPIDVKELIVVNNAVEQPNDAGITRTYKEAPMEIYSLQLDSISWTTAISFMSSIKEADFFDDVFLHNESVRTDNDWMTGLPLSEEFRHEIFNTQGFDGIVSIDRILFKLDEHVSQNSALTDYIDAKADILLSCSIYLNGRERPLTTFTLSDSVFFKRSVMSELIVIFKEIPEDLLYGLAYSIGEKLAYSIIPSWITAERTVYVGIEARMQEAYSYSKTGKWSVAESIWLNEYNKKSKESDKGKTANNIALANEMQDRLEEALLWAEKSREHFLNSNSSNDSHINRYISDLQKRIHNSQILNLQLLGTGEGN